MGDAEEYDDYDFHDSDQCDRCFGSGYWSTCIDDMCHGREECIHGDDATCPDCHGEGVIYQEGNP